MNTHQQEHELPGTLGPPRRLLGGHGDVVPPLRPRLRAASINSRNRGETGPIPDFPTHGPADTGASAPAGSEFSEEQPAHHQRQDSSPSAERRGAGINNNQNGQRPRRNFSTGIPTDKESAPVFLSRKRKTQQQNNPKIRKNTRAVLNIEAINLNGRRQNGRDKWLDIPGYMKANRIGVLAVGETHLTQSEVEKIESSPSGKKLRIFNCPDPDEPTARTGVAIVLHRDFTNVEDITIHRLIPGRAILAKLRWHSNKTLTVLAVYAPADSLEANLAFWEHLRCKWLTEDLPVPDIELGDKNITLDKKDRYPERVEENDNAVLAVSKFRSLLDLRDGWREQNPDTREYTYASPRGTLARLDSITVSPDLLKRCSNWRIIDIGQISDHRAVGVTISAPGAPYFGKGRFAIPLWLLDDKEFMNYATVEGKAVEDIIDDGSAHPDELQLKYAEYKKKLVEKAIARAKEAQGALEQKKQLLQNQRHELLNPEIEGNAEPDPETQKLAAAAAAKLQKEIDSIKSRQVKRAQGKKKAKFFADSDRLTKLTMSQAKSAAPRDTITKLKRCDVSPEKVAKKSCDIAELMRDYHHDTQRDETENDPAAKTANIEVVMHFVEYRGDVPEMAELAIRLDEAAITASLCATKKNKATGGDGGPSELWQRLHHRFLRAKEEANRPRDPAKPAPILFNLTRLFTAVFNDIATRGVVQGTGFSDGWLCPIYKKGDPENVANYRPITVLNADYKIFTTALNTKLAKVAGRLINRDQAGFMKGRGIADQVFLTQSIIEYSEEELQNGVVVALDQEKAYDRISHRYLWRTLEKSGIPPEFIQTVKYLYEGAQTKVIVNGEVSSAFNITRGVRQGDPLSCLLFNIGIEPLAEMLRKSDLEGFKINELIGKVILSMYADDTTVYLRDTDDFSLLEEILQKWCVASSARFNIAKTELIPVGSPEYRAEFARTRQLNPDAAPIPDYIRVAVDGESTRLLSSQVGNGVDLNTIHNSALEKANSMLVKCDDSYPTLEMRRHFVQVAAGSMTQYKTQVDTMPPGIEKRLTKMISDFMNEGKAPLISRAMLESPISAGGKKIISIPARNAAVNVMKLRAYLNLDPETRAKWAFFADKILAKHRVKNSPIRDDAVYIPFIQTWTPVSRKVKGRKALHSSLAGMIKVANKYGVEMTAPAHKALLEMPLWHHYGQDTNKHQINNSPVHLCLCSHHGVSTVGEALAITARLVRTDHETNEHCPCDPCTEDRGRECLDPHRCATAVLSRLSLLGCEWDPRRIAPTSNTPQDQGSGTDSEDDLPVVFSKPPAPMSLTDSIRIFTKRDKRTSRWPQPLPTATRPTQPVSFYVDVTAWSGRNGNSRIGIGIHSPDDHRVCRSIRIPVGSETTVTTAEYLAIVLCCQLVHPHTPISVFLRRPTILREIKKISKLSDSGFIGVKDKEQRMALAANLMRRTASSTFYHVASPSQSEAELLNEARVLANAGAERSSTHVALATTAIREHEEIPTRPATDEKVEIARRYVFEETGKMPSAESIWRSLKSRDIDARQRNFLWKLTHNAFRVGHYWTHIPECGDRAICDTCEVEESMEHILFECKRPGQAEMWALAKSVWSLARDDWQKPSLGGLLGCALVRHTTAEGKPDTAADRLHRILIPETAYQIWTSRCDSVIARGGELLAPAEAHNVLRGKFLERIKLDSFLTRTYVKQRPLLDPKLVRATWGGVLAGDRTRDWLRDTTEVLVGIGPYGAPGPPT
uniref:Reverse transcriptase domain-containing protein n=1 Tax=Mycena chlorophos TaxID=658473 RepID=A0ABQ0LI23_MYCCL|nr:predicted protein [Mycena chlorophos]